MDTALPQKFTFILDRNLVKADCTGNRVCTSCDIVFLCAGLRLQYLQNFVRLGCSARVNRLYFLKIVRHLVATKILVSKNSSVS